VGTADRFAELTCPMCGKPVDLDQDYTTDEAGKIMHAECYFKRVGGKFSPPGNSNE
jgi:hypothetical protein